MKQITQSQNASSQLTKTFETSISSGYTTETKSLLRCKVYNFEHYNQEKIQAPLRHKAIGNLIAKWETDEHRKNALEDARQWVSNTFYNEEGVTVRNLRLHKGWSQSHLAKELGTSQSHIARIEKGTENIAIETCRKLCNALNVDMNILDQALRNQEEIAWKKAHNK